MGGLFFTIHYTLQQLGETSLRIHPSTPPRKKEQILYNHPSSHPKSSGRVDVKLKRRWDLVFFSVLLSTCRSFQLLRKIMRNTWHLDRCFWGGNGQQGFSSDAGCRLLVHFVDLYGLAIPKRWRIVGGHDKPIYMGVNLHPSFPGDIPTRVIRNLKNSTPTSLGYHQTFFARICEDMRLW